MPYRLVAWSWGWRLGRAGRIMRRLGWITTSGANLLPNNWRPYGLTGKMRLLAPVPPGPAARRLLSAAAVILLSPESPATPTAIFTGVGHLALLPKPRRRPGLPGPTPAGRESPASGL